MGTQAKAVVGADTKPYNREMAKLRRENEKFKKSIAELGPEFAKQANLMNTGFGSVLSGASDLITGFSALSLSMAGIGAVSAMLTNYFTSTEDRADQLAVSVSVLKGAWDDVSESLNTLIDSMGGNGGLAGQINDVTRGLLSQIGAWDALAKSYVRANVAEMADRIEDNARAYTVEEAAIDKKIAQLKLMITETDKYTESQRKSFANQAQLLEEKKGTHELAQAIQELQVIKASRALNPNTQELNDQYYQALAKIEKIQAQSYERQIALSKKKNNLDDDGNKIKASTLKLLEEQKNKTGLIGSIEYEISKLQKDRVSATSDQELIRINGRIDALKEQKKLYEEIGTITRLEPKQGQVSGSSTLPTRSMTGSVALGPDSLITEDIREANIEMGNMIDLSGELNISLKQAFADASISLGQSIGNMLSGFSSLDQGFGNILIGVGEFLSRFGKSMIEAASAAIIFNMTLLSAPWLALAAGIAVVAAGQVFSNIAGGGFAGSDSVQKFADGGVIFGPTLGLMGEYAGASRNPEVVAPLSTLAGMLGGNSTQLYGQLSGNDILISNERTGVLRKRMRGR